MTGFEGFILFIIGPFVVAFIVASIVVAIQNSKIRTFENSLRPGVIIAKIIPSENPFEEDDVYKYEITGMKYNGKGDCWVKLQEVRKYNNSDYRYTTYKTVKELYNQGYKVYYQD
jgi:hypothetical protein